MPHPHQHLVSWLFFAFSCSSTWVVVLICFFLLTNDVEHLSKYIFTFYISFVKCLFRLFPHFVLGWSLLLSIPYIFWILIFDHTYSLQIFSLSPWWLFIFLVFFKEQKVKFWWGPIYQLVLSRTLLWAVYLRNICLNLCLWLQNYSPVSVPCSVSYWERGSEMPNYDVNLSVSASISISFCFVYFKPSS